MDRTHRVEHLNHLGIVAEVCREIGLAAILDRHAPQCRQQVSVGTATVALMLNGLGFSNRQLYLVPQFFADKPLEMLLGAGITADDLNDDCFGRTLDWLYDHNVTTLFAEIAVRARQIFGVKVERTHGDTTSFSVHGAYDNAPVGEEDDENGEPALIGVTYGYSRDHREDLKQWMMGIVTSGEGIPLFMQPLNGNASDKKSLLKMITTLVQQMKASQESPGVYVADSGLYSTENMTTLNTQTPRVDWISRVPETSALAQEMTREAPEHWTQSNDGTRQWWSRVVELAQGQERWIVVRTKEGETRARATMAKNGARDLTEWTKKLWHLGHARFACQADAAAALTKALARQPAWLAIETALHQATKQMQRGRPSKKADAQTVEVWSIQATVTLLPDVLEAEAMRRAAFIIGTNLVEEPWTDEAIIQSYRGQSVVEKGFAFLKDPLFLASSVFVKKPERIMAIAFIMMLCLLVYKLAEFRVRQQLAATAQTIPNQVRKSTARPTMRWIFQCFEGIDLLHSFLPDGSHLMQILRLTDLHRLILRLLGPLYEKSYFCCFQTAE